MEKKKVVKKNATKKVAKKPVTKKKETKKKGFTLIELLAVIIILGILMIIAIPSVTSYISNSRKSAYVDTAKEIVGGTRNLVNEGRLGMYDTNTTYYIPASYIKTENSSKSPYGEFTEAYVAVIYNGTGYDYYWISTDDTGQGVKEITPIDKLDTDNIKSDLKDSDISDTIETTGIGNRNKILILDPNTEEWKEVIGGAKENVSEITGTNGVIYPEGKDKYTVEEADIVKIANEEFYVVKRDGNDLYLLGRYNLKVGNITDSNYNKIGEYSSGDPGYGLQSSEARGHVDGENGYGTFSFSNTNYWAGKVGTTYPGVYCRTPSQYAFCTYVYDQNSNLYPYLNNYKKYLEEQGAAVKECRVISYKEGYDFSEHHYDILTQTSSFMGTPYDDNSLNVFFSSGNIRVGAYDLSDGAGIRPFIVI